MAEGIKKEDSEDYIPYSISFDHPLREDLRAGALIDLYIHDDAR